MGCFITIEVEGLTENAAFAAVESAFLEIKKTEKKLSRFLPASETSQINLEAHRHPVPVSSDVFDLLSDCERASQITQDAFDITTLPLTELWKKADSQNRLPSAAEVRKTLEVVGHRHVELCRKNKTVFFHREGAGLISALPEKALRSGTRQTSSAVTA